MSKSYEDAKVELYERHDQDVHALQMAKIIAWAVELSLGLDEVIFNDTRGTPKEAFARQVVFYLLHCGFSFSYDTIANAVGRDRTTVRYSVQNIEDKRDDIVLDAFLDDFLEKCQLLAKIREIKYDYSA